MIKIAVLTSGGDAPGMNAAIRAVVRTVKRVNGRADVGTSRWFLFGNPLEYKEAAKR